MSCPGSVAAWLSAERMLGQAPAAHGPSSSPVPVTVSVSARAAEAAATITRTASVSARAKKETRPCIDRS